MIAMFCCYIQCFIHLPNKSFTLNLLNARHVEKLVVSGPGASKQIVFMCSEKKTCKVNATKFLRILSDINFITKEILVYFSGDPVYTEWVCF